MNRTVAVLLAGLAALTVLPLSAAHVQVTSVPPSGPVPADKPTEVSVTLSALCPVVVAEYAQKPELQLALVADGVHDPPAWLAFTGDAVPFTVAECGTDGYAHTTGMVAITPGALAPAFVPIALQPGAVGETNEGGAFNLTVAYAWNVTLVSADLTAGANGTLVLDVTANADTILLLGSAHGLAAPAEVEVASPLLDGKATRRIEVPVKAEHAGVGEFTISAKAKGKDATGAPFALAFTVLPGLDATAHDHAADEHTHAEADSKASPMPVAPLLAVALLALALRRRS
jgi:MYXO-CTERM domain-containing protein